MKQKLTELKEGKENFSTIGGDFNIPVSVIDWTTSPSSHQKKSLDIDLT